jgi:hypothetical protein
MPSPALFARGFSLIDGAEVPVPVGARRPRHELWRVADAHVRHVVVRQFDRYEFPFTLTLAWEDGSGSGGSGGAGRAAAGAGHAAAAPAEVAAAVAAAAGGPQILYSEYGSPYECSVGPVNATEARSDGSIVVSGRGVAARRRDLPREADAAGGAAGRWAVADAVAAAAADALAPHRVVKSRFSTSMCAVCGERILAGLWIVEAPGGGGRRGGGGGGGGGQWAHLTCGWGSGGGGGGGGSGAVQPRGGSGEVPNAGWKRARSQ